MDRYIKTAACRVALASIVVSLMVFSLSGCGKKADVPETAETTGVVLVDGKPLEGAEVMFHPEGGGNPAHGVTNAEGRFTLTTYDAEDGAIPGTHKVTVQYFPEGALPGMENVGGEAKVPEQYASVSTTPLTEEVKSGETNDITIEIQK